MYFSGYINRIYIIFSQDNSKIDAQFENTIPYSPAIVLSIFSLVCHLYHPLHQFYDDSYGDICGILSAACDTMFHNSILTKKEMVL